MTCTVSATSVIIRPNLLKTPKMVFRYNVILPYVKSTKMWECSERFADRSKKFQIAVIDLRSYIVSSATRDSPLVSSSCSTITPSPRAQRFFITWVDQMDGDILPQHTMEMNSS